MVIAWFLALLPTLLGVRLAETGEYVGEEIPFDCIRHVQIGSNKVTWCNITDHWKPTLFANSLILFIYLPFVANFIVVFFFAWMCGFKPIAEQSRLKYLKYLKFIDHRHEVTFKEIGTIELKPTDLFQSRIWAFKWFWGPYIMIMWDSFNLILDGFYFFRQHQGYPSMMTWQVLRNNIALRILLLFCYFTTIKNWVNAVLLFGSIADFKRNATDKFESDGVDDLDNDLPIVIINERLARRVAGRDDQFGDALYEMSDPERTRLGSTPEENPTEYVRPPPKGAQEYQEPKPIPRHTDMSLEAIQRRNQCLFDNMTFKRATFIYPCYYLLSLLGQDGIPYFLQYFYIERYIVKVDWFVMLKVTGLPAAGILAIVVNFPLLSSQIKELRYNRTNMVFFVSFYLILGLKSMCNIVRFGACWYRMITGRAKINCYQRTETGQLIQTPFNYYCLGYEDWFVLVAISLAVVLGSLATLVQYLRMSKMMKLREEMEEAMRKKKEEEEKRKENGEHRPKYARDGSVLVIND